MRKDNLRSIGLRLSERDLKKLERLANESQLSRSAVMRALIQNNKTVKVEVQQFEVRA